MDGKIEENQEQILKLEICYPGKTLMEGTIEFRILKYLFKYIAAIVSVKTDAGYYICASAEDLSSSFKVEILDKNESNDIKALVMKRIESIRTTLNNCDFNKFNKTVKWCLRAVTNLKIDTNKFLFIEYNSKKYYIKLNIFENNSWETRVIDTVDKTTGLKIRQIVDPLIEDYGLYVNHSKKFSDFCICWNILHLYEHLMVPWDLLGNDETILTNGFTTPTGLCYCFTITKTLKQLIKDYNNFIKFFNKVREDPSFLKSRVKLEERRTLSESIEDKDFSSFGRADPELYNHGYDIEIFKYFANQPLEILIITDKEVDVSKLQQLNKPVKVECPKKRTFKEPSLTMFRNRMVRSIIIEDMSHKTDASYKGVDCVLNSVIGEDLSEMNILISNVFRTMTSKELEKYISTHVIPPDNIGLSRIDEMLRKTSFYTFDALKN